MDDVQQTLYVEGTFYEIKNKIDQGKDVRGTIFKKKGKAYNISLKSMPNNTNIIFWKSRDSGGNPISVYRAKWSNKRIKKYV
jgi:hypothetical protein